jgi:hypothetical protein
MFNKSCISYCYYGVPLFDSKIRESDILIGVVPQSVRFGCKKILFNALRFIGAICDACLNILKLCIQLRGVFHVR